MRRLRQLLPVTVSLIIAGCGLLEELEGTEEELLDPSAYDGIYVAIATDAAGEVIGGALTDGRGNDLLMLFDAIGSESLASLVYSSSDVSPIVIRYDAAAALPGGYNPSSIEFDDSVVVFSDWSTSTVTLQGVSPGAAAPLTLEGEISDGPQGEQAWARALEPALLTIDEVDWKTVFSHGSHVLLRGACTMAVNASRMGEIVSGTKIAQLCKAAAMTDSGLLLANLNGANTWSGLQMAVTDAIDDGTCASQVPAVTDLDTARDCLAQLVDVALKNPLFVGPSGTSQANPRLPASAQPGASSGAAGGGSVPSGAGGTATESGSEPESWGSCDVRSTQNACYNYLGRGYSVDSARDACENGNQGEYFTGHCWMTGSVGSCDAQLAGHDVNIVYYAPMDATAAQNLCAQFGGVFSLY